VAKIKIEMPEYGLVFEKEVGVKTAYRLFKRLFPKKKEIEKKEEIEVREERVGGEQQTLPTETKGKLKKCLDCGTRYAVTLEKCPNCSSDKFVLEPL